MPKNENTPVATKSMRIQRIRLHSQCFYDANFGDIWDDWSGKRALNFWMEPRRRFWEETIFDKESGTAHGTLRACSNGDDDSSRRRSRLSVGDYSGCFLCPGKVKYKNTCRVDWIPWFHGDFSGKSRNRPNAFYVVILTAMHTHNSKIYAK